MLSSNPSSNRTLVERWGAGLKTEQVRRKDEARSKEGTSTRNRTGTTGRTQLIRIDSMARFSFKLSGYSN